MCHTAKLAASELGVSMLRRNHPQGQSGLTGPELSAIFPQVKTSVLGPPVADRERLSSEINFELKEEGVREEFKQAADPDTQHLTQTSCLVFIAHSLCVFVSLSSVSRCFQADDLCLVSAVFSCNRQEHFWQIFDISAKKWSSISTSINMNVFENKYVV